MTKEPDRKENPAGPLTALAEEQRFDELLALVKSATRLDAAGEDVARAFVLSGFSGHRELITAFVDRGVPPETGFRSSNILHVAARYPDARFFGYLVSLGPDCSQVSQEGETPLGLAVRTAGRCEHPEVHAEYARIVRTLLQKGVDTNVSDWGMFTALDHACKAGDAEVAEALLSAGATLEACADRGYSALQSAIAHLDTAVLSLLLQHGAGLHCGVDPEDVRQLASYAADQGWTEALGLLIAAGWPAQRDDGTDLMACARLHQAKRRQLLEDLGLA